MIMILAVVIAVVSVVLSWLWKLFRKPVGKNPFSVSSLAEPTPIVLDQKQRKKVLKKKFSPGGVPSDLDAIVIGSGIGGLGVASILSKAGWKVLVLEQHGRLGGCCHTFKDEKGREFDVGIHYIGEMGHNTIVRNLSDQITNGKLDWTPLSSTYDTVVMRDINWHFPISDRGEWIEELKQEFPDEKENIKRFFDMLESQKGIFTEYLMGKALPLKIAQFLVRTGLMRKMAPTFYSLVNDTVWDTVCKFTENQRLRTMFVYMFMNYGMDRWHMGKRKRKRREEKEATSQKTGVGEENTEEIIEVPETPPDLSSSDDDEQELKPGDFLIINDPKYSDLPEEALPGSLRFTTEKEQVEVETGRKKNSTLGRQLSCRIGCELYWCQCGICTEQNTDQECFCCREAETSTTQTALNIVDKLAPVILQDKTEKNSQRRSRLCITDHPKFSSICLDTEDGFQFLQILARGMKHKLKGQLLGTVGNKSYRFFAYTAFTYWVHGNLGYQNRKEIPACVKAKVLERFPEVNFQTGSKSVVQDYDSEDDMDFENEFLLNSEK